jgi:hypothetical protein
LWSYWLERPLEPFEAAIVVALSFVIAFLSWRYVERPFRHRHDPSAEHQVSPADRRFVAGALASVVAVIAVAMGLKVYKGFPERYDANVRTVLEQMVSGNPVRSSCDDYQNIFLNDNVCNFGRKKIIGESYEVALFGDSMADHLTPLVAKFAKEKNLAFRQVTNGGCASLFGIDVPVEPFAKSQECSHYQKAAEKFIDANPGLKIAVISNFWEKWLGRIEHPHGKMEVPPAQTEDEAKGLSAPLFDKVLRDTVEVFTKRGIKVLLIGQIPTYKTLPVRCITASVRENGDAAQCGMSRVAADAQLMRSNGALKRAAATIPGVSVSLPSTYMCQEARCAPVANGTFLYKNGTHVNRFGAEYLRRFVEFPSLP